ncbi:MAG: BMP family ABC transporter substrate-binding protein [Actinomycetia bacterium]|nr:BMP family ABC transporter substrate-binding protein [Actinomycetes bacterium]
MRSLLKRRGALFSLLLVLALVAAACSSSSDDDTTTTAASGGDTATTTEASGDDTPTTTAAAAETTTTAAEAMPGEGVSVGMAFDIGGRGDQSFNDSAAAGLEKAITDYGIDTTELEADAGGENREENLRLLAEAGNQLLIAVGFAFAEGVTNVATDFPDTFFGIIDDGSIDLPNVAGLVFAEHEGSALVGAAAALKSESGTIGFIGGVSGFGLIEKFQAGYEFGAQQINPDIEILVTYLSAAPDFAGFNDPAKATESALGMYDEGADVIYHAAGGSGAGLFEAAKSFSESSSSKVWAIGVDSDQYNTVDPAVQEFILTSMIKRVDVSVYTTITNFLEDNKQSGVLVFDLAADGVGYSTSGGFVDDIVDQLDALREQIVTGELEVPTEPAG